MSTSFDPYFKWLGIPPEERPAHNYRLLGINTFESDPDVISNAADRQMAHVRTFQGGPHAGDSQRLLNELAQARLCLLDPARKTAYDNELRSMIATYDLRPVLPPPPPPPPPPIAPVAASPPEVAAGPRAGGGGGASRDEGVSSQEVDVFQLLIGAARFLGLQVQRLWLSGVSLRVAYVSLGSLLQQRSDLPEPLRPLQGRLQELSTPAAPSPAVDAEQAPPPSIFARFFRRIGESWRNGERSVRRRWLQSELGRKGYALLGAASGPPELVEPLQGRMDQMARIDQRLEELSEVPQGQSLSPRHVVWIAVGVVVGLWLLLSWIRWLVR